METTTWGCAEIAIACTKGNAATMTCSSCLRRRSLNGRIWSRAEAQDLENEDWDEDGEEEVVEVDEEESCSALERK